MVRYSRQREAIYKTLTQTNLHPNAEAIYILLKNEYPSLSLGTVYRNLKQLCQEGLIVRMPDDAERYDANTKPHDHFKCRKCGGYFDFSPDEKRPEQTPRECDGYWVERCHTVYFGICDKCREIMEKTKKK